MWVQSIDVLIQRLVRVQLSNIYYLRLGRLVYRTLDRVRLPENLLVLLCTV